MILLPSFLLFFCLVSTGLAKTFETCELVYELRRQGFPENIMKEMICIIGYSSSFRTQDISGKEKDGSYNHGLFQINDRYWCSSTDYPGNECNVRCADLRTDDITAASNCAKIILNKRGLNAWVTYEKKCLKWGIPEIHC